MQAAVAVRLRIFPSWFPKTVTARPGRSFFCPAKRGRSMLAALNKLPPRLPVESSGQVVMYLRFRLVWMQPAS